MEADPLAEPYVSPAAGQPVADDYSCPDGWPVPHGWVAGAGWPVPDDQVAVAG